MVPTPMSGQAFRPSVALAAYAESLVDGRRVIVFGDATAGLAERLVDRGARLVQVCDPDGTRVSEAAARNTSREIAFAPLTSGGLDVREHAFDFGIVEDLNSAGPAHSVIKRLERALAPGGVALVAVPNPGVRARLLASPPPPEGALDYYELYDALKSEFAHVRMLGQTPFVGYAVVDFAANGQPEPSLDTAFVPGGAEEPEWFVGLASKIAIRLDEFAVVQLPFRRVLGAGRSEHTQSELENARRAERSARERMAKLEAELGEVRRELRVRATAAPRDLEDLRKQVAERDAWINELEARAAIADARADEVQAELDEARERAEQDTAHGETLARLERERERALSSAQAAEQARQRLQEELEKQRGECHHLRAQLAEAEREAQAAAAAPEDEGEIDRLEAQLAERGATVRELQRRAREAQRVGQELLVELEKRENGTATEGSAARVAELSAQLDRLAALNAEREADLEAARWTITALEGRLSGERLAGSTEELAQARAELQRQAALIAQLQGSR